MASNKRQANRDLNHENWDEEDEEEEAGTFVPIDKSKLGNRVIRKAKRSKLPETGEAPASVSCSPFAAFSGFSSSNTKLPSFSFGASKFNTSTPTTSSDAGTTFSFFQKSASHPVSNFASSGTFKSFDSSAKSSSLTTSLSTKVETNSSDKKQNGNSENKLKEVMEETMKSTVSSSSASSKPVYTRSIEYYRQLQSLNESVMMWMQFHMSKMPSCDFNPVFIDYKKHYDTLNLTYPLRKKDIVVPPPSSTKDDADITFKRPSTESTESSPPKIPNNNGTSNTCTHSSLRDEKDETDYGAHFASNTTNTSTLSFSMKSTPTGTSSITPKGPNITSAEDENTEKEKSPPFSFDWKNKNETPSQSDGAKEIFKSSFSFSCNALSKPSALPGATQSGTNDSENAEYEPPKNDVTIVKEKDAFYSKKCKLFFKKGDSFADKGVGNLYLKPYEDGTQLVVRADTNLGNILLNIILNSLPVSRSGKNNVLLVCIPNPPLEVKKSDSKEDVKNPDSIEDVKKPDSKEAIPMLIRVKTSEDADELYELLKQHMKT